MCACDARKLLVALSMSRVCCDLSILLDSSRSLPPYSLTDGKVLSVVEKKEKSSLLNGRKPSLGSQYLSEYKWIPHGKILWSEILKYTHDIILCYQSSDEKKEWTYCQCMKWCQRELITSESQPPIQLFLYSSRSHLLEIVSNTILLTKNQKLQKFWLKQNEFTLDLSKVRAGNVGERLLKLSSQFNHSRTHLARPLLQQIIPASNHEDVEHPFFHKVVQNILMILSYSDQLGFDDLDYSDQISPLWTTLLSENSCESTYCLSETLNRFLTKPLCCQIEMILCYIFICGEAHVDGDLIDTQVMLSSIMIEILKSWNPLLVRCEHCEHIIWGPVKTVRGGITSHLADYRMKIFLEELETKQSAKTESKWNLSESSQSELRMLDFLVRAYCLSSSPMWVLGCHTITAAEFVRPLETVFSNPRHLLAYRDACEWKFLLNSLIKHSQSHQKTVQSNQWDVLINQPDGAKDDNEIFNWDSQIDSVVNYILIGWKDVSEVISFTSQPMFWNQYSSLSSSFIESQSFHFLPFWPILTGFLDLITYFEQRARWKKKKYSLKSEWKEDHLINIHLLQFLMDTSKFREYCGGGDYLEKMCWSIRGKYWIRLLYNMRSAGYALSDLRETLNQALEECGQLPEHGGLNPADVEEIESLAVLYRGQQEARASKRHGYAAFREQQNIKKIIADGDIMTPPKRYSLGNIHHMRYFHGSLVKFMNLNDGISKRRRLIYKKHDNSHEDELQYSTNPPVTSDSMAQYNHRDREMIVEKFALCRYLSLINPSPQSQSHMELSLYDEERLEISSPQYSGNKTRRLKDMLMTNRGPGAWIHGSVIQSPSQSSSQSPSQRKWLASYCEGTIWLSIFTLCFWDIIFDPTIPFGLMRAYFDRPIDLLPERYIHQTAASSPIQSYAFYTRRYQQIQNLLKLLKKMSRVELYHHFSDLILKNQMKPCFGINWKTFNQEFVLSVICSLGSQRLSHVMHEMVRDPVSYSRGMPDLLFCLDTQSSLLLDEEEFKFQFVKKRNRKDQLPSDTSSSSSLPWETETIFVAEVKSTNDELSHWQKLWIKLLTSAQVHYEECRVN
jgi:hypothetical protein